MRFITLTMILLLQHQVSGAEPITLRVLCYNIHHAEGGDRVLDVERIASVINSASPDLVALQEVDQRVKRTERVDQPTVLGELTKMHVVFGGNIELQGGHYGNAILSKFPIAHHRNHSLPNFDNGEQRGFLESHIDVPGMMDQLIFLATHFDHRSDDKERVASAQAMNSHVAQDQQRPVILAGDLNDVRGSATLNELEMQWTHTSQKPQPTVPVSRPSRQIDFILFRPESRWKVREFKVLEEAVASDHRAILAVLEIIK